MTSIAIIGAQWGDEGKGKITDFLASRVQAVVRFQGGHNAGHTIWVNGKKNVTHLLPSGVITPGVVSIIGQGVVVDPAQFKKEVENLRSQNLELSPQNLKVSSHATVITIYHQLLDQAREKESKLRIGTTGKGIGPAYEDRASRRGMKVFDLLDKETLKYKLQHLAHEKMILLKSYGVEAPSIDEEVHRLWDFGQYLKPYVAETFSLLQSYEETSAHVLYEGAQGLLLDIDFGTYPYVTSSTTGVAAVMLGASGMMPDHRWGVLKAYTTRVGEGPFPTQIHGEKEEKLRKLGGEYGSTTGRERKCGWLDLPLLRYCVRFSNLNGLVLTKCDVLALMNELKVCTAYKYQGQTLYEAYPGLDLSKVEPVYEDLAPLAEMETCSRNKISKSLQDYVRYIEKHLNCPVVMVSFGVDREQLFIPNALPL
jgi:adenylosuccinate synthase